MRWLPVQVYIFFCLISSSESVISRTKIILKISLYVVYEIHVCLNIELVSFSHFLYQLLLKENYIFQAQRLLSLFLFVKFHAQLGLAWIKFITSGPEQLQDTKYSRKEDKKTYIAYRNVTTTNHISVSIIHVWQFNCWLMDLRVLID